MKICFATLIFFSLNLSAQKWKMTIGEYTVPAIDSLSRMVYFSGNLALTGNNGSGTPGLSLAVSTPGTTFTSTWNTLHGGGGIDQTKHCWYAGNNDQGQGGLGGIQANVGALTKITVDSLGNDFAPIIMACGFFFQNGASLAQGSYFVKQGVNEDSVFACGLTNYGMAMNGTSGGQWTRPTFVHARPGHHILEISAEKGGIILYDDGKASTWGWNGNYTNLGYAGTGNQYQTPHDITPASETIKHVSGGDWSGFLMVGTLKQLYGFGTHSGYFGNATDVAYSTPRDLTDSILAYITNGTTRTTVTAIAGNSSCWHVLMNDSTCHGWGDNAFSSIGNGGQPNMATLAFPWFPDPTVILFYPQTHPVQVTKKHNFTNIYSGFLFTFVFMALDANGQLWASGRNKGTVIPNGVTSCENFGDMAANYPDSWDLPDLTPVTPYAVASTIPASCPGCKTGVVTSFCSDCTIPTTTPTAAIVGGNTINTTSSSITASGLASTCTGGKLTYYKWTGPDGIIEATADPVLHVSGLSVGTHTFNLNVQDNGFNQSNVTLTVNVLPTSIVRWPYGSRVIAH